MALTWGHSARAEPPRLSGTIVAGELRVAIFAGRSGEAPLVVQEGDQLGDERVTGIGARSVELSGPAGKRLVILGDDPTARTALATAIPPPPLVDAYRRERETENDQ